jgi:hypothetical protein
LIVKNARALVAGALQSLAAQTVTTFEVIVVDGASTDGTLALLEQAAKTLPLRIISEPDSSLADAFAKGLRRASGEIVGMLCADERYYPNTIKQVLDWFAAQPDAVMCGGKVDFIDEHDTIVGSHLTAPFNLPAHLACEQVPSNLSSFFNRPLIGEDFRFDSEVPTCPDYEYWARLGFRFPPSAFKRYDVSIAQAYRTRDSMSFRAESFAQFCRDKLAHLHNLLAKGYAGTDQETLRRRSSAGIHMWAAEQLSAIEPGHTDILAHCAAAAEYDEGCERIAHFVASISDARYEPATGTVKRNMLGPRSTSTAQFACGVPPPYWQGATVLEQDPLTLETANVPWGYSAELAVPERTGIGKLNGGQYWIRLDLEVVEGSVGISLIASYRELLQERIFRKIDGRKVALIPIPARLENGARVMVRSGEKASSVVRIHRAELLCDPDRETGTVAPIDINA